MYTVSLRPRIRFLSARLFVALWLLLALAHAAFAADQLININTADPATLAEQLPGIGPAKARAIVVHREQNGLFTTLEQLTDVKGIGPSTLEKIRPFIYIDANELQQTSSAPVVQGIALIGKTQVEHERVTREAVRAAMEQALRYQPGLSP